MLRKEAGTGGEGEGEGVGRVLRAVSGVRSNVVVKFLRFPMLVARGPMEVVHNVKHKYPQVWSHFNSISAFRSSSHEGRAKLPDALSAWAWEIWTTQNAVPEAHVFQEAPLRKPRRRLSVHLPAEIEAVVSAHAGGESGKSVAELALNEVGFARCRSEKRRADRGWANRRYKVTQERHVGG